MSETSEEMRTELAYLTKWHDEDKRAIAEKDRQIAELFYELSRLQSVVSEDDSKLVKKLLRRIFREIKDSDEFNVGTEIGEEKKMMSDKLKPCPFCGDKMKKTRSILNIDRYDAVRHIKPNNDCPVGRGIYRIEKWNKRADDKKIAELEAENKSLDIAFKNIVSQSENRFDEYDKKIAELDKRHDEDNRVIAEKDRKIAELRKALDRMTVAADAGNSRLAKLEKGNFELRQKLLMYKVTMAQNLKLKAENARLKEKIKALKNKVADLSVELAKEEK